MQPERCVTPEALAELLCIAPKKAKQLLRQGEIPSIATADYGNGRKRRVALMSDVAAYQERKRAESLEQQHIGFVPRRSSRGKRQHSIPRTIDEALAWNSH